MFVQHILDFIQKLQMQDKLADYDQRYLKELVSHFEHRLAGDSLNEKDITFLKGKFANRWACPHIVDTENDYMANNAGANQCWIQLAKDLSAYTNKSYISYLFPDIENTTDYNNFSSLTETENPLNLYLGYGGKTLYRKRALCEYLMNDGVLKTCRSSRKAVPVTIDELMRLKWNYDRPAPLIIKEKEDNKVEFFNFWDFLQQRVFIKLQANGSMPLASLVRLFELVDFYETCKASGKNYSEFRPLVNEFLTSLYRLDLHQVNYLYGVRITIDTKEYYLFELLIDLYRADDYTIDAQMHAIARWLYQYNSGFVIPNQKLAHLYPSAQDRNPSGERATVGCNPINKETAMNRVKLMLISLLVEQFDIGTFGSDRIHFWDISRTVFINGANIFNQLIPYVLSNDGDGLLAAYANVLNGKIINHLKNKGFYFILTEFSSTNQWYTQVAQGELSKRGIYWFDPELMMYALPRYSGRGLELKAKIDVFLDKLVRSYTQIAKEHLIQFRVNILFNEFLHQCDPTQQKYLLLLLNLYSEVDYKSSFVRNCLRHTVHRLCPQQTNIKVSNNNLFFSSFSWPDIDNILKLNPEIKTVEDAIEELNNLVHNHELSLAERTYQKMTEYLKFLTKPILSIDDHEQARLSAQASDFLGAPT